LKFEVLVCDNASQDGSADMIRKEFADVCLFPMDSNLGFAAGMNVTLRKAQGDYLLLLNPDTCLHAGSVQSMIRFLKENSHCGIVGPKLLNENGSIQNGVRQFPTPLVSLVRNTVLKKTPFFKNRVQFYSMRHFDLKSFSVVDQVSGAAMMFSRKIFEKIGFLDERFFIFFEEVDYCKRVKKSGLEVCYFPEAKILHHGGKSRKPVNTFAMITRLESEMKYHKKYMSPLLYPLYNVFFKIFYLLSMFFECLGDVALHCFCRGAKFFQPSFRENQRIQSRKNKSDFRWFFLREKLFAFLFRF
jgi:GT2 family glycosyltransferase